MSSRYPLTVGACVEIAVVERSGFEESRHIGAGIVVDADGQPVRSVGDAGASIYPRSTLKPFQALAARRAGAVFHDAELVLSTASHAGTPRHQKVVASMLAEYGNTEDDLRCPPDFPLDADAARDAVERCRLAMNCSGKHAAMLAACRVNGWETASYLDGHHPIQRAVIAEIEEKAGERVDHLGVDGCGAPIVPVTLRGLATGIASIVSNEHRDETELVDAVRAHPWAIDGDGRPNTAVIDTLGIYAKGGAEGVMTMGVPGVGAVAVKVLDGSMRAATLAALTLLGSAGMVDGAAARDVIARTSSPVLGRGEPVGRIRVGDALR